MTTGSILWYASRATGVRAPVRPTWISIASSTCA